MPALTQALIYQKTKKADLSSITNLNIWGSKLDDISIMQQMVNVEVLAFSVNDVSDLSPLQNCTNLKELYIRRNQITDMQQIMFLSTLPQLTVLLATENPIANSPDYRLWIIKALPKLKKLDEMDVTDDERMQAARKSFSIKHEKPGRSHASAAPSAPSAPQYPTNVAKSPSGPSYPTQPQYPVQPQVQQPQYQAQPQVSYPVQAQPQQPQYQSYQQPQQSSNKPQVSNTQTSRKIVLAVLNLIDGLDVESLETIKKQINALQAGQ